MSQTTPGPCPECGGTNTYTDKIKAPTTWQAANLPEDEWPTDAGLNHCRDCEARIVAGGHEAVAVPVFGRPFVAVVPGEQLTTTSSARPERFWFADTDDVEPSVTYRWQPVLQVPAGCFPLTIWFASKAECLDWIRSEIPAGADVVYGSGVIVSDITPR